MAEHDGKVFCTTLPSGKIFSFGSGHSIISNNPLKDGWHHVVAVRSKDQLSLYLDGKLEVQSGLIDLSQFDLDNKVPLRIGFGANDFFDGDMADLRLYNRVLSKKEIKYLSDKGNILVQNDK
jgi:hypothetical protein